MNRRPRFKPVGDDAEQTVETPEPTRDEIDATTDGIAALIGFLGYDDEADAYRKRRADGDDSVLGADATMADLLAVLPRSVREGEVAKLRETLAEFGGVATHEDIEPLYSALVANEEALLLSLEDEHRDDAGTEPSRA